MMFKGVYAPLSNMYLTPININGYKFNSVEQGYQFNKIFGSGVENRILSLNPYAAKKFTRTVPCRRGWEQDKLRVMSLLVKIKFSNPQLLEFLCSIEEEIVEHNYWHDNFWGSCTCQKCRNIPKLNHLGKLLQDIKMEALCINTTQGLEQELLLGK